PPQQQIQGQQPPQYPFQYSGQPMQYPIQPIQFPIIPPLNPFLSTVNIPQTISDSRLPSNENVRDQQNSIQPSQQMEQAAIQTVKRLRQCATTTRSVHNMLIPPIPAYSQQQTSRIPLLPYTTERNQSQRQSQTSISPTHKRADESEEDDFLDEIIPGITMPHLPPHKTDIEISEHTRQNRGYELLKDPIMQKSEGSPFIDFRCIIKKFEPHVIVFDFPAMQGKLEKEQFERKDEFIRKIITLENQKVIQRLTGLLLSEIIGCKPSAISRARTGQTYRKSQQKPMLLYHQSNNQNYLDTSRQRCIRRENISSKGLSTARGGRWSHRWPFIPQIADQPPF
ncbi:MAG: hypothetical protein EZS28_040463, partial [Streblomastix strix]